MIYIYYCDSADIDYIFLLALYKIAKSNNTTKLKDTIQYKSLRELQEQLAQANYKISTAKIDRILKNKIQDYKEYFIYNEEQKTIILLNDFRNIDTKSKRAFITLSAEQVEFLINSKNNLLCKYYIYIKYYCGKSKTKTTDFTIKQFLSAVGYSTNSNNNISKISELNGILQQNNMIKIQKYKDTQGHERNRYII